MRNRYVKIILLLCCTFLRSQAQDSLLIDSLQTQLKKLTFENSGNPGLQDSAVVYVLFYIGQAYGDNYPVQAMEYTRKALSLSKKIGWKKRSEERRVGKECRTR